MTYRLMYLEEAPDLDGEPEQRATFDSLRDGQKCILRLWLGGFLGGDEVQHIREMHHDRCQLVYRVGRGRGKARAWVLVWIEEGPRG
jgi:hypothetical protein